MVSVVTIIVFFFYRLFGSFIHPILEFYSKICCVISPKTKENCCEMLRILYHQNIHPTDLTRPKVNFIFIHNTFTNVEILKSPFWSLYGIDHSHAYFVKLPKSIEFYNARTVPFLYLTQFAETTELARLTLQEACQFGQMVLSFALNQGKTAVHCHAGLGRTGVLITCYLIWDNEMNPGDAIDFVRAKRESSVQTKDQTDLVYRFSDFLKPLRTVFNSQVNFHQYLNNQQHILHGVEARILKNIPKIAYVICERLSELEGFSLANRLEQKLLLLNSGDEFFYEKILSNQVHEKRPTLDQIRQLSDDLLSVIGKEPTIQRQLSDSNNTTIRSPGTVPKLPPINLKQPMQTINEESAKLAQAKSLPSKRAWQVVLKGCLPRYLPNEIKKRLDFYETSLKNALDSWTELANETDSLVLLALLGKWFHSLKEPCLQVEALFPQGNIDGDVKIQPNQKWTILYLCNALSRLCQKNPEMRTDAATLLCDWLTWSRDEKSEAYFLSCLVTVDSSLPGGD